MYLNKTENNKIIDNIQKIKEIKNIKIVRKFKKIKKHLPKIIKDSYYIYFEDKKKNYFLINQKTKIILSNINFKKIKLDNDEFYICKIDDKIKNKTDNEKINKNIKLSYEQKDMKIIGRKRKRNDKESQ